MTDDRHTDDRRTDHATEKWVGIGVEQQVRYKLCWFLSWIQSCWANLHKQNGGQTFVDELCLWKSIYDSKVYMMLQI